MDYVYKGFTWGSSFFYTLWSEKKQCSESTSSSVVVVSESDNEKKLAMQTAADLMQRLDSNPSACIFSKRVLSQVKIDIEKIDTNSKDAIKQIQTQLILLRRNTLLKVSESIEDAQLHNDTIQVVTMAKEALEKVSLAEDTPHPVLPPQGGKGRNRGSNQA